MFSVSNVMDRERIIRDFFRRYVDTHFKNPRDTIRLSSGNTDAHNMRVCEVCVVLLKNKIPFYTEVKLKCGLRPDIVCPTHVKQIIEVMATETLKSYQESKLPKLPEELEDEVLVIEAHKPFEPKMIL